MPFAAAIGAAAGIGGALITSGAASDASNNATNAQTAAAQANNALQTQIFNQTTANEQPYLQGGNNSLAALLQGLGLSPGSNGAVGNGGITAPFTAQMYQQSPGYQFQLQQGTNAILDNASALGGVNSGNTLRALTQYGQGLANQDYQQAYQNYTGQQQNIYNRLAGLVTTGQGAASNQANAGTNFANQVSSNNNANANAVGANAVSQGNITGNLLNSLTNNSSLQSLFQGLGGGGSSSGGLNLPGGGVTTTNFGTSSNPFYVPNF